MALKILAVLTLIAALLAAGCGLSIHFGWVGEMEPTPHIILGGVLLVLVLATSITALAAA